MKIKRVNGELEITSFHYSKYRSELSNYIEDFKKINPDYEVFNITLAGKGLTVDFYIIWKEKMS
jgi:hypothetical protein